VLANCPCHLEAIEPWHVQVEQHQVERGLGCQREVERGATIARELLHGTPRRRKSCSSSATLNSLFLGHEDAKGRQMLGLFSELGVPSRREEIEIRRRFGTPRNGRSAP